MPKAEMTLSRGILLATLSACALFTGCAAHQGSGLLSEFRIFRPLDDIQDWQGVFDPISDGEKGFFSENPKDYIDKDGIATGVPTHLRRGWVVSPWAPKAGIVDVRHYKEGEIVICPFTGKPLRVPEDKKYKAVHVQ